MPWCCLAAASTSTCATLHCQHRALHPCPAQRTRPHARCLAEPEDAQITSPCTFGAPTLCGRRPLHTAHKALLSSPVALPACDKRSFTEHVHEYSPLKDLLLRDKSGDAALPTLDGRSAQLWTDARPITLGPSRSAHHARPIMLDDPLRWHTLLDPACRCQQTGS